uniref:hypothetical protein n=1 Tax=Neorhizobium sp. EC2-8 TaxID=3129230 RepID=UPI003101858E
MKIVKQKIFVANVSRTNFVFVKLYTDDGNEGVGKRRSNGRRRRSSRRSKSWSVC